MSTLGSLLTSEWQFLDDDGAPLTLGTVQFYAAGTTTPQDTYTTSALTVANSNPVQLDAAGRALIWLDPTLAYKWIVSDANGVAVGDTVDAFYPSGYEAYVVLGLLQARWSEVTITATGTQNDLDISEADLVIFANASDITVTGIVAPSSPAKPGKPIRCVSTGAGNVYFSNQDSGSAAANRLTNFTSSGDATIGGTPLAAGKGTTTFVYDSSDTTWRMIQHDQGAMINYTASSTVTGWSSFTAGREFVKYLLHGSQLLIQYNLEGTSNATTVSFTIPFTTDGSGGYPSYYNPLGFTYDNGSATTTTGAAVIGPAASTVICYTTNAHAGWTNSGAKIASGQLIMAVI